MATNDVEIVQSFCRKYINKGVKNYFKDVTGEDDSTLNLNVARQVIKRICLHKDDDTLLLTLVRLLIWWIQVRGIFEEFIYGIPSEDFHISKTIYPQVKLYFYEDKYTAATLDRRPARAEISFRWRTDDFGTTNVTQLGRKIINDFAKPVLSFTKGRTLYTYVDKSLGYYFQVKADSEAEAKKVIEATIRLQDDSEPDWTNKLKTHTDDINYSQQTTLLVMGETFKTPKKRPIATVKFNYAELHIAGLQKPIIIADATGNKLNAVAR